MYLFMDVRASIYHLTVSQINGFLVQSLLLVYPERELSQGGCGVLHKLHMHLQKSQHPHADAFIVHLLV